MPPGPHSGRELVCAGGHSDRHRGPAGPPAAPRRPGAAPAVSRFGLRHLHVGHHRQTQGSDDRARVACQSDRLAHRRIWRDRGEPSLALRERRLRRRRVGALAVYRRRCHRDPRDNRGGAHAAWLRRVPHAPSHKPRLRADGDRRGPSSAAGPILARRPRSPGRWGCPAPRHAAGRARLQQLWTYRSDGRRDLVSNARGGR